MNEREKLERQAFAALEITKRRSKLDPAYFISNCCYTFDPKREPYHFPFKLFPFQVEYVATLREAIEEGTDIMVEKCREMGATYTTLYVMLWFWMYIPGSNFLVGSRKEDYVDNTKANGELANKEESLFGKLEYTLNRMNPYFLPRGFSMGKHMTFMSLINPENGNVISGESSNANFSRGGRQKAILLDEFAFWDNDSAAWGSTADTTNCRIALTTPGIRPSKAKKLRFGEDEEEIKIITLPYDLDPRKDQAWLDAQRKRRSKEDFAREIMIDWQGSLTGVVYPEISLATIGDYPYDPRWPLYRTWDFGLDGVSVLWFQKNMNNDKIRIVDYYENHDRTIGFYFPMCGLSIETKYVDLYTADDIKAIRELKKLKDPIDYGDPDVSKRSLISGTSTRMELKKVGINVQTNRMANDFASRREQTKITLQEGIEININSRTQKWILCMENARYPERSENSQATTAVNLPIHNWTSHGRTSFEYGCVNYRLGTGAAPSGGVISQNEERKLSTRKTFAINSTGDVVPPDILEKMKSALPKR